MSSGKPICFRIARQDESIEAIGRFEFGVLGKTNRDCEFFRLVSSNIRAGFDSTTPRGPVLVVVSVNRFSLTSSQRSLAISPERHPVSRIKWIASATLSQWIGGALSHAPSNANCSELRSRPLARRVLRRMGFEGSGASGGRTVSYTHLTLPTIYSV